MSTKPVVLGLVGALIIAATATESMAQMRGGRTRGMSRSSSGSSSGSSSSSRFSMRSAPSRSGSSSFSRSAPRSAPSFSARSVRSTGSFRPPSRPAAPRAPSRPSVSVSRPSLSRSTSMPQIQRVPRLNSVTIPRPTAPRMSGVSRERSPQSVSGPSRSAPARPAKPALPTAVERPSVNRSFRVPRSTIAPEDRRSRTIRSVSGNPSRTRTPRLDVFRSSGSETGSTAKPALDRPAVVADARKTITRTRGGDSSPGGQATGVESLYPRRNSKLASADREPQVIGSRPHRSTPFARTLRPEPSADGALDRRRRPAGGGRGAFRPEGRGDGRRGDGRRAPGRWPERHRQIRHARRDWVRDLRHRHHNWWISFGLSWGTPYVWEPYWYPYRPYIGQWYGYDGWYHCTPYTTGIWWPWHHRVRLGYVYSPYTSYGPYTSSVYIGYDPLLYFWWPAPYSVSVNYYSYEYGSYPPDSVRDWSTNDWVYYEPSASLPPEIEMPLYTEEVQPRETYIVGGAPLETVHVGAIEAETVPAEIVEQPVYEPEPTPAGIVEAATVTEDEPVETVPVVVEPEPYVTANVNVPEVKSAAPPPVKPSIRVPAPGRSRTSQTILATGGIAFLGAALWMAWPRP